MTGSRGPTVRYVGRPVPSIVRDHLAAARVDGVPFPAAFERAVEAACEHVAEKTIAAPRLRLGEARAWREAFKATRDSWGRAYAGRDPLDREAAMTALAVEDRAAHRLSAGRVIA